MNGLGAPKKTRVLVWNTTLLSLFRFSFGIRAYCLVFAIQKLNRITTTTVAAAVAVAAVATAASMSKKVTDAPFD